MKASRAAVLIVPLLAACQMTARQVKLAPLETEGEAWVYLQALPEQAARLEFTVESLSAVRADGSEIPLQVGMADVSGKEAHRQRLLASGRIPTGDYTGLSLRVKKAALGGEDGTRANLLPPSEPVKINLPFGVARRRARVVWLALQFGQSVEKGFGFRPSFTAAVPPMPLVERLGFVSATGSDVVTVFDRVTRQVVAVVPTGRDPRGLALDRIQGRLYVALGGEDQVAALDVITGDELGRARLQPGDQPMEVGITQDGRLLVVTNPGSNTVSFVDAAGLFELNRVRVGQQPTALLMDRAGKRAFVLNKGSSSITALDLAARAAVGNVATEPAPARAALNRAGDRMYVVAPGSSYMAVLAVPGLAPLSRIYVGFGAVSVHVNPRTDFAYVSQGDVGGLQVFLPLSPMPMDRLELPGPATWLAIDDLDDVLVTVIPSRREAAGVELTGRKTLPGMDVGEAPYAVVLTGQRN